jgi:hypothetical protein
MNATETRTRTRSNLILESRTEYGSAARRNRGRYAGHKIHRLRCEYVVGVVEGSEHRPGTYGANFLRTGKPSLFHVEPVCMCTQGQMAGSPNPSLDSSNVTCEKCLARMDTLPPL